MGHDIVARRTDPLDDGAQLLARCSLVHGLPVALELVGGYLPDAGACAEPF